MMANCPHADTRFCPLYLAAHLPTGLGCDDGQLSGWEPCGVARGVSYAENVAKIRVLHLGLVEQLEWKQMAEERAAQRQRNLRAAGLRR